MTNITFNAFWLKEFEITMNYGDWKEHWTEINQQLIAEDFIIT